MNKVIKGIIVIILLVVLVFAVYSSGMLDSLTTTGETYEANGVTFQYPESWQEAKSVSDGSIAAVANANDSRTSVVIQQVPSEYGSDIQSACSNNNKNLAQGGNYINIQEVKTTINNNTAIVHRYIINEPDGSQKEHVATWMKMSDNNIYVILFSTPVESYEQQRSSYDLVAGTFKLANDTTDNQVSFDSITNRLGNLFNT